MSGNFKRICALLLSLVMIVSVITVGNTTYAAGEKSLSIVAQALAKIEAMLDGNAQKKAPSSGAAVNMDALNALREKIEQGKTSQDENAIPLDEDDYSAADSVFDKIDEMEKILAKKNGTQEEMTEAAIAIVMASDSYVEGSLERNGNAFTWWTTDGVRCMYNPRMREIEEEMTPSETAQDVIVNEPVAKKGGSPSGNQVYLVGPYYGHDETFTNQYKNEAKRIAKAVGDTDGYTLYSGTAATVGKVAEAVANGAVVLFDSHGMTDYTNGDDFVTGATSSYLCLTSTTGLTSADYADGALYYSDGICINGATIANHMTKKSPGGLVWLAICLGMATNTMCNPMREMGVEVVYGYSQSVTFGGDYLFEETFWDEMLKGNTVTNSIATMKNKWGNWDWSTKIASNYGYNDGYSTITAARNKYAAFPVVVSDEDAHPGQRKGTSYGACSLQTVKSTYSLNITSSGEDGATTNYRKLEQYIDDYGTIIDGIKTWLMYDTSDGMEFYYLLQNTSDGILFDLLTSYVDGGYEIMTDTSFLLSEDDDDLLVDFWMGYAYRDSLLDSAEAYGTIDRTTFTKSSAYSIDGGYYYISDDQASDFFNSTLHLLCSHWDWNIYAKLGFGLKGLGFINYAGYGNLPCTHTYDNACDATCNNCGETRPVNHSYSGACDTTCNICGYGRTTSASHSYGNYTKVDDDYHSRTCSVCGIKETVKHRWVAGTILQQPTETTPGLRVHNCADCNASKTVVMYLAMPGDLDGNDAVDEDDVIYLLQYLLMPEDFPVSQSVDYDLNGYIDEDDVIYLLQHLLMPEDFPLV